MVHYSFYTNNGLMCYGLANMFADQTIIYFGILVTLLAIAFLIPVVIIIITCILQVICLCRASQFPASPNQRHVTITVILMSSLFVICNSALYGYVFLTLLGLTQPDPATIIRYIAVFGTELPILGSDLNPVIIISRSSGLR